MSPQWVIYPKEPVYGPLPSLSSSPRISMHLTFGQPVIVPPGNNERIILPGVISGGLFAFVTSFDEVVVVLFLAGLENTTIPIQMWTGLREQLSPTILAVATCLIILSTLILVTAELLRRRSERLRGINR